MSEPSNDFVFPEDEPPAPRRNGERGEALRGLLEVIVQGRTRSARLLRLEVLAMLLRVGGSAQTIEEVARRLRCSKRRVEQAHREMRTFVHLHR